MPIAEAIRPPRTRPFRSSALVRTSALGFRLSTLTLMLAAGCMSQEKAREDVRKAYEAGLQQGRREAEMRLTQVMIRGPVQRASVTWREGLTLAQVIVEANYTGAKDPAAISITRENRIVPVDVNDLLRGLDHPLQPGDIVDIR